MDRDYARKKAKCVEAINGIILFMKKNGIPLPSKYQKSRAHEDLPPAPDNREAEILRRFRYLEPESREQMAEKLNDLLVYAEVAKVLRSELIAIIVLDKLRKWENLLLHPELEMPPIPSPSPEQKRRLLQRKKTVEKRDRRTANVLRQYEEHGEDRRAAVQSVNPFDEHVRTIKLPPQTIGPPQSQAEGAKARVNLDEQRRQEIAEYEKFGAIKKKLHFYPEYERNLKGPKLPEHELPLTSRNRELDDAQSLLYKELEKQKKIDQLRRQLKEALASITSNPNNQTDDDRFSTPSLERRTRTLQRRQLIEDRDRRVASVLKQYEEQGENRRAAVQSVNPYDQHVRTTTLPPQTIGPPQSQIRGGTAARVDLDEQRRRDIEDYKKFGAVRKRLHDMPEFERDLKGPKLPEHDFPSSSAGPAPTPSRFKEFEKQRELDNMRRQLQEALATRKRRRSKEPNSDQKGPPDKRTRPQSIEERDRRVATAIKQHEKLGARRRAAVQSRNPSKGRAVSVRIPDQTISVPQDTPSSSSFKNFFRKTTFQFTLQEKVEEATPRVDLDEQSRRDIEEYKKFGAIRKRQHELPEYQRDLTGPKFRDHGLPSTSKPNAEQAETQSRYKELEKQRELDKLKRKLQEALVSRKKDHRNDPASSSNNDPNDDADDPNNPGNSPNIDRNIDNNRDFDQ